MHRHLPRRSSPGPPVHQGGVRFLLKRQSRGLRLRRPYRAAWPSLLGGHDRRNSRISAGVGPSSSVSASRPPVLQFAASGRSVRSQVAPVLVAGRTGLGGQPAARQRIEPLLDADFATNRRLHIVRYRLDQRLVTHCYRADRVRTGISGPCVPERGRRPGVRSRRRAHDLAALRAARGGVPAPAEHWSIRGRPPLIS
jgi:hypothetical protein